MEFWNCTFDDAGIEAVAYCENVVELTIVVAKPKLTDAQVMTLVSKLRKLDRLDLRASLAADVSVATFAAIGSLPHLERLVVSNNACFTAGMREVVMAAQRGTRRRLVIL